MSSQEKLQFGIRNVLIVGDSNLRAVSEMSEMHDFDMLIAPGCRLWDKNNQKWRDRLMTPLTSRMHSLPEVKLLVVHLGTNDEGKSPDEFADGVYSFIEQARYLLNGVEIVFSEVLPRCPHYNQYNDDGRAAETNALIEQYNLRLQDVCQSSRGPITGVMKHSFFKDAAESAHLFEDSVHLSVAGARLFAYELREEINRRLHEMDLVEKCTPRSTPSRFWQEQPTSRRAMSQGKASNYSQWAKSVYKDDGMSHRPHYRDRPKEAESRGEFWSAPPNRRKQKSTDSESEPSRKKNRSAAYQPTATVSVPPGKAQSAIHWSGTIPEMEPSTDSWRRQRRVDDGWAPYQREDHPRLRQPSASISVPQERGVTVPGAPSTPDYIPCTVDQHRDIVSSVNGNIGTFDRRGNESVTATQVVPTTPRAALSEMKPTRNVDGETPNPCVFTECRVKPKASHNMARHFFSSHLPYFLRRGDGLPKMNLWAKLFLRILGHMQLETIEDLHEHVLSQEWFPLNRSADDIQTNGWTISEYDKTTVRAFAQYIGIESPTDFSETRPQSPALLINWRILRCIMLFGMTAEERRRVVRFERPPKGKHFTIRRRH